MRDERLWMYKTISLKQKVWTRYSTIGYAWLAAFAVIFVAIFFNRNNGLANRLVDEKPLNGPSPESLFPAPVNPTIIGSNSPVTKKTEEELDPIYKLTKLSKEIPNLFGDILGIKYKHLGLIDPLKDVDGFCFGASKVFLETDTLQFLNKYITLLGKKKTKEVRCFVKQLLEAQNAQLKGFSLPFNQVIKLDNINHALNELSEGQKFMIRSSDHAIAVERIGQYHYVVFDSNQPYESTPKRLKEAKQVIKTAFSPWDIKIMMSSKQPLPKYEITEQLEEQLFQYAKVGDLKMSQALLRIKGINVNKLNAEGVTPLYVAFQNKHTEIVKVLLEHGGDVNKACNGVTPLYSAALNGHTDIVKVLLEINGIKVNKPRTDGEIPLFIASRKGHTEIVKVLLEHGGDVNKAYKDLTPLFVASLKGHTDIVKVLLRTKGIKVNEPRADQATPLFIASQEGHTEIVKALLRTKGINVNKVNVEGVTPLFIASQEGHTEIVKALLRTKGIDVNISARDGATPLLMASQKGYTEIVNALLEKDDVDVNKASSDGATPLFIASQKGHAKIVKALLESGADPNKVFSNEVTPLLTASHEGHIEIVKALLENGADVNKALSNEVTPLMVAIHFKHNQIATLLRNAGGR